MGFASVTMSVLENMSGVPFERPDLRPKLRRLPREAKVASGYFTRHGKLRDGNSFAVFHRASGNDNG
jgi:hypothetical protein